MDKAFIYRHTGSHRQIVGAEPMRLGYGKADNVNAVRLYNSSGMELTALPDRGMDIYGLRLCGQNMSFLSKTGVTAPQYFVEDGAKGFLKNFFVGFLTTCGLSYMGAAHVDNGEPLGLHGQISNIPAENCYAGEEWIDNKLYAVAQGNVCQTQVFQENIQLTRRIELSGEENVFKIHDHIENRALRETPFMLLYHMNYGYPLLSENTEIHIPSKTVVPRDEAAAAGLENHRSFETPDDMAEEQVFFHQVKADGKGNTSYVVCNRKLGLGLQVEYCAEALPFLTQWKCIRSGEYVLGVEPGNCHVNGRARAREEGLLQVLRPLEERDFVLTVRGLTNEAMIQKAIDQIKQI